MTLKLKWHIRVTEKGEEMGGGGGGAAEGERERERDRAELRNTLKYIKKTDF